MDERLRNLNAGEEGMLVGRTLVIRKILDEGDIRLHHAPFSPEVLDQAWERIVVFPVDPEALDWVVGSFGGLLIEHFRARFGFKLMELTDEYGTSICLVETRTGVRLFPFDTVQRRIAEGNCRPFGEFLSQIDGVMAQHGLVPHESPA